MSAHTKGPWEFGEGYVPGSSTFDLFGLGGRQVIASTSYENMWLSRYDKDEDAANARLIAAAPDMLEALKALVEMRGNTDIERGSGWANARAAIAKAEAAS